MKFLGKSAVFLAAWVVGMAAARADVQVAHAWARATVPGQPAAGVFMELTPDADTRLVDVESPAAEHAEIHEMAMQDNVMRMRQIAALDLPAGQTVALAPGGYHIMLLGLAKQLKEGEQVALTLVFERDGQREAMKLDVPVRALTHGGAGAGHSGGHGHPHGSR